MITQNIYQTGLLLSGYTHSIDALKSVLTNISVSVGGVVIIFGGISFGVGLKNMDQQLEMKGLYTIAAGSILIGISSLVSMLM